MARIVVVGGFAESLVLFRGDLLRILVAKGHTVIACAPAASEEIVEILKGYGVSYINVAIKRTGVNPYRDLLLLNKLRRIMVAEKSDVCILYTIKPVIFGSLAARLAGVKKRFSIVTGLGYIFTDQSKKGTILYRIICGLYKFALGYNTKVFFQNSDDLSVFKSEGILAAEQPVGLINGSGVNVDYFADSPANSNSVSFLLIARLLFDKGIKEYAEAARSLKSRYPGAKFRLVGWFDSNPATIPRDVIDTWVNNYGIEYLGKLEDVRPAISSCSVYVLPSYREGTPRTVLEAMAMGRPVVTTDVPGCRETVVDGVNGFLVPSHDSVSLAEAMERYLKSPELIISMGRESRRIAVEKYDVHKVNQVLLEEMELTH